MDDLCDGEGSFLDSYMEEEGLVVLHLRHSFALMMVCSFVVLRVK